MPSMPKQEPDQTTPLLSSINPTNNQLKRTQCKAVTFILVSKFCQFFSFFGLRAVIILYLVDVLLFKEDTATVIYHGYNMIYFFSPLLGAYLADILLGRFKSIAYITVLIIIGNIIVSLASVPEFLPMRPISILGLVVAGLAYGSILPCSNAFGGDQFKPNQTREIGMYFSMLFIIMKLSQIVAFFVSPVLRADVHCFGQSTCFPLIFGVIAVSEIFSLIIFLIGYPYYKIYPASGNIIFDVIKCIAHALTEKFKKRKFQLKKNHWLDYADNKYDTQMISDIKILFSVSMMFLPIPIYRSLIEQQGSKWTLQATRLNNLVAGYQIKPDQMQVTNAILGIIIIYILDYVIYPLLRKCNLLTRTLQRMAAGGFFVSFAFVAVGFLQLSIEKNFTFISNENNTNFENTDINNTLLPLSAELHLSDMKSKQELLQHSSLGSVSLSILLQIPQYFLMTFGEMMFSISSLHFAYSEAPMTMKTIIIALLYINSAIGNIIVMIITEMNLFQRQSYEFFFYAILLAIDMLIFAMMAHSYKYRNQDGEKSEK